MINVPCKNCKKRHMNCHAHCEEYRKYREEHEKLIKARNKFRETIYISQASIKRKKELNRL